MWVIATGRLMAPKMWEYDVVVGFFDIDHAFDVLKMYEANGGPAQGQQPYGLAYMDTKMDLHFLLF